MTNSRNMAIHPSTYVLVRIYPTTPWQVKVWSVSFQYAPHIHDVEYVINIIIFWPELPDRCLDCNFHIEAVVRRFGEMTLASGSNSTIVFDKSRAILESVVLGIFVEPVLVMFGFESDRILACRHSPDFDSI